MNAPSTPWYEKAFAKGYLERYPHRNKAAAEDIPFLKRTLGENKLVLDLCCGAGRYAEALACNGLKVIGIDLSIDLLRNVTQGPSKATYLRADIRALPFKEEAFDGIVNLFTSFGYFETDAENGAALREAARVLKKEGVFIIDFLNRTSTLANLVPRTERNIDDRLVVETRRYDRQRKRIEKTIRLSHANRPGETSEIVESVRAFSPEELAGLAAAAGLRIEALNGDLREALFEEATSPRCVLTCRRR